MIGSLSKYLMVLLCAAVVAACGGGGGGGSSTAATANAEVFELPGQGITCPIVPRNTATLTLSYALGKTFKVNDAQKGDCGRTGESMKFNADGSAVFTYPDGFTVPFTAAEVQQAFTTAGVTDDGVTIRMVIYRDGMSVVGSAPPSPTFVMYTSVPSQNQFSAVAYSAMP